MSTEFITMLPPPGSLISSYNRNAPHSAQNDSIPSTFLEAMSIREEVFVGEQHVPLENEFDVDDPRSWHWVTYASVGSSSKKPVDPAAHRGSTASRVAVGTIRLVPPPHPPHPAPGSEHKIDNSEGVLSVSAEAQQGNASNRSIHNPHNEPYIKLGRLATLAMYRKYGLGRMLLDTALEFASAHASEICPPPSATDREAARIESGEQGHQRKGSWDRERWRGLVLVHAQKHLVGLYQKWGFTKDDGLGEWSEEGIVHVGMWRRVPVKER